MFARLKTVTQNGRTYQYLQVLESYHYQGQSRHRVVANHGRYDPNHGTVDRLVQSLARFAKQRFVGEQKLCSEQDLTWGPVLLARHLWEQLGLDQIITDRCRSTKRGFGLAEAAFVLVPNRLCEPGSEHGLARWLEHTFVCDGKGRLWRPDWLASEQITKHQQVKVRPRQLNRWYRTLDALYRALASSCRWFLVPPKLSLLSMSPRMTTTLSWKLNPSATRK